MSQNSITEVNKRCINNCINASFELMRSNYEVTPMVSGEFGKIHIKQMDFVVSQYKVKGVGNLLILSSRDSSEMQMESFVITPYFKNLPIFSTDYIFIKERRCILNELYSVVSKKDALYEKYMEEFTENKKKHEALMDMPEKPCWYDEIRSVHIAKVTAPENDKEIQEIFEENLETFLSMEKESPLLSKEEYQDKWQKTQDYIDGLIANGGASTDLFKSALGPDKTKKFFDTVFFASSSYKYKSEGTRVKG